MTSSILVAATHTLGADPRAQSWYLQGGSSMQATQLISSLRALGAKDANLADLLETDNVVNYLVQLENADEGSEGGLFVGSNAPDFKRPKDTECEQSCEELVRFNSLASAESDDSPKKLESEIGRFAETRNAGPMEHEGELGPEASFLLRAARQSGINTLVSLMEACLFAGQEEESR